MSLPFIVIYMWRVSGSAGQVSVSNIKETCDPFQLSEAFILKSSIGGVGVESG